MSIRYFVYIFLYLLAAGAVNAADSNNKTLIRFDGVYKSNPSDGKEPYCHYLRFYPKGSVMTVSTDCDQSALSEIQEWLTFKSSGAKAEGISRGRSKIVDNKISFSAVSREGTVSYRGEIENDYIHLKIYSSINKNHREDSYTFVKW
jgi:hypothetical protein